MKMNNVGKDLEIPELGVTVVNSVTGKDNDDDDVGGGGGCLVSSQTMIGTLIITIGNPPQKVVFCDNMMTEMVLSTSGGDIQSSPPRQLRMSGCMRTHPLATPIQQSKTM